MVIPKNYCNTFCIKEVSKPTSTELVNASLAFNNILICLKEMMKLTGFDDKTCVQIQNPILALYSASDIIDLSHQTIRQHMNITSQNIRRQIAGVASSLLVNKPGGAASTQSKIAPPSKFIEKKTQEIITEETMKDIQKYSIRIENYLNHQKKFRFP